MAREEGPHTAIARRAPDEIVATQGKYTDLDALAAGMAALAERCNVLSPVARISAVPPGHAITLSIVQVAARDGRDGGETYSLDGGRRGLAKSALDKIAGAAGISWNPRQSGRLDDGSDPLYCHMREVGVIRDLDGSERIISGEVEMDLRDGSPTVAELRRQAAKKQRDPEAQISQMRAFILRHAESKAKNRAIRQALGVKSGYTESDLRKPFVCPKLVFTGDFGDPELNREVAVMIARKALGVGGDADSLYGPRTPRALTADTTEMPEVTVRTPVSHTVDLTSPQRRAPPPVGDENRQEALPIPQFFELDDTHPGDELVGLARRKGRYGPEADRVDETRAAKNSREWREKWWAGASRLPDVPARGEPDEDEIPDFARDS